MNNFHALKRKRITNIHETQQKHNISLFLSTKCKDMKINNKPADQRGNSGSSNLPKIQTDTHPSNFSDKHESNTQKWNLTKI